MTNPSADADRIPIQRGETITDKWASGTLPMASGSHLIYRIWRDTPRSAQEITTKCASRSHRLQRHQVPTIPDLERSGRSSDTIGRIAGHCPQRALHRQHREIGETTSADPRWSPSTTIDGNPDNNDIEQSECLPAGDHLSHHGNQPLIRSAGSPDSKRLGMLLPSGIGPMLAAEWHREHGRRALEGRAERK